MIDNPDDDEETRRRQRQAELDALGPGPAEAPDPTAPPATQAPTADASPHPQDRNNEPWWWDYNNGSPPAVPLGGGMQGWQWDGTRWNQTDTPGINTGQPPPGGGGGGGGGHPSGGGTPSMPSFQPAGGGGGGSFQSSWTAPQVTPAHTSAITEQMRGILSNRLTSLSQPYDILNDPIYGKQTQAFDAAQQRNAARQRRDLAERAAAGGTLHAGGFNTGVNQIREQQGEKSAAYGANLAGQRLTEREQQLDQAIQMARAVGQDDVAMQLENEKLALSQASLQLQGNLGYGDLNLRDRLGSGQLGLGLLNALQGNQQFYDSLGFNYAGLMNNMNHDAVIAALGGGG